MKTYHKKPPRTKNKITDPAPAKKRGAIATLANTLFYKVARAFAPLTKFQQALCYTGFKKKPSKLAQWFGRNAILFAITEKVAILAFIVFALFTNAYLLLILPAIGAMVFYRNRLQWLWWKFKVFVLHRNYYQHRRKLYKQGSLYHHLNNKRPLKFGSAIIWGQSESIQQTIFKRLQREKILTTKEYIKL